LRAAAPAFRHQASRNSRLFEFSEYEAGNMIVSSSDRIEGARSLTMLGRIRAATGWHATGRRVREGEWKEAALQQLIRRAEDIDADAIIGLDYEIDGVTDPEDTGLKLQRIAATGLAVRIGRV
jgi:hypothetical protein